MQAVTFDRNISVPQQQFAFCVHRQKTQKLNTLGKHIAGNKGVSKNYMILCVFNRVIKTKQISFQQFKTSAKDCN